jgi:hypothetical protein
MKDPNMSKFERKPITEASDQQLRDFCEMQQLDVSDCKSRAELMAVLGPAWEHDYITVLAEPEFDEDERAAMAEQVQGVDGSVIKLAGGIGANDPKVRLSIGQTPLPGGKDPVPVGVNGKTLVIQRNMEVEVPYRFYLALQAAIREEVTQDEKTGELHVSTITNYPMQVKALPSEEEIAAWHKRTDNEAMPA